MNNNCDIKDELRLLSKEELIEKKNIINEMTKKCDCGIKLIKKYKNTGLCRVCTCIVNRKKIYKL